jgi:hypothetical protein
VSGGVVPAFAFSGALLFIGLLGLFFRRLS